MNDRDGTIQIGDEIVNIMGRSLRELNIQQVQELLMVSTQGDEEAVIDLVICRSMANYIEPIHITNCTKQRNNSTDTYFNDVTHERSTNESHLDPKYNEFASIALK